MKKILITIMMLLPMMVMAYDFEVDGIYYDKLSNTEVAVTRSNNYIGSYSGKLSIPKQVYYYGALYSVTSIGGSAFSECTDLTSIEIPNSVTSIGFNAFFKCTNLASIVIPNSLTKIEMSAFEDCKSLTSIILPNSVIYIDAYAFSGCSGLTSFVIPNNVTWIGEGTFMGCTSLTSIEILNHVTTIGDYAFCGCTSLTSIEIPNSVTSIGFDAFSRTEWYNSQPDGLVYAGNVAYDYKGTMPNGTTIQLKEGALGIAMKAFEDCTGLISITIPNSVTTIGYDAFAGCTNLTSIEIPNTVTSIGSQVFRGCSSLTSVVSKILYPFSILEPTSPFCPFYGISEQCSLYIPYATKKAYISAGWDAPFKGGIREQFPITVVTTGYGCISYNDISLRNKTDIITVAENTTICFCPDEGYRIKRVMMDSQDITANVSNNQYFFICDNANATLEVEFEPELPKLIYMVDDAVYRIYEIEEGLSIIPEPAPTKEGYTFSGWSNIPATMPAEDVVINGSFTINKILGDNAIGADNVMGFVGSNITLPILMKNTESIIGMQFDLTLPEGVSVVLDNDNEYMFLLTNRAASSHSIIAEKMSDGSYRILVSSLQNSKFKGTEGVVMEAMLAIANDMLAGEYPVKIANIEMTTAQNIAIRPEAFVSKLIVQDIMSGDANCDGTVSVTDVTMTISHILGQTPDGFNAEAADVNGDGSVSVTDVTIMIDMILKQK